MANLNFVLLYVEDVAASEAFYAKVFGHAAKLRICIWKKPSAGGSSVGEGTAERRGWPAQDRPRRRQKFPFVRC